MAARGDGNIRYFEISQTGDDQKIYYINDSRSTKLKKISQRKNVKIIVFKNNYFEKREIRYESIFYFYFVLIRSMKAFNFVTRRALDTSTCEVQRALKLEGTSVNPISFRVPRKLTKKIKSQEIIPQNQRNAILFCIFPSVDNIDNNEIYFFARSSDFQEDLFPDMVF